jgi:hypothetical protein
VNCWNHIETIAKKTDNVIFKGFYLMRQRLLLDAHAHLLLLIPLHRKHGRRWATAQTITNAGRQQQRANACGHAANLHGIL